MTETEFEGTFSITVDGNEIPSQLGKVPFKLPVLRYVPTRLPAHVNIGLKQGSETKQQLRKILRRIELLDDFGIDTNSPEAKKFIFG